MGSEGMSSRASRTSKGKGSAFPASRPDPMSHFLPDEIVVRRAKLLARFTMLTLVVACGSRAGSVEDSAVGG